MREFTIGNNDAGQRLDRFVSKAVPKLPDSLAQKYIRIKRIKVKGQNAKRDYRLSFGDIVQLYINDEFFDPSNETKPRVTMSDSSLSIVYEDDNLLLINKAAGILCHSAAEHNGNSLISMVQAYLIKKGEWSPEKENSFRPALCNRIDRNTSGIVIAAKNAQSLRILNEKIKLREIDKFYLAAVHGVPDPLSGSLEGHILKDSRKNRVELRTDNRPGSKTAALEYSTITVTNQLSLLECRLLTGRTHQIRAQLADFGHPLLGDSKYGNKNLNKQYEEKYQALCSYKLSFDFKSDAGVLQYLNRKIYSLKNIHFVDKYFHGTMPSLLL